MTVSISTSCQAYSFHGVIDQSLGWLCGRWLGNHSDVKVTVLLSSNISSVEFWMDAINFFNQSLIRAQNDYVFRFFPPSLQDSVSLNRSFETKCDQMRTLIAIQHPPDRSHRHQSLIIGTTPEALLSTCPPSDQFLEHTLCLKVGMSLDFKRLVSDLRQNLGYDCETICETPGQFAVRGGLIDIYPINASHPYRLDFFGDEIESIRCFDPTTQRSTNNSPAVIVAPLLAETSLTHTATLLDYLPDSVVWCLHEPDKLMIAGDDPILFGSERESAAKGQLRTLIQARSHCSDYWLGFTETDQINSIFSTVRPASTLDCEPLDAYCNIEPIEKTGSARLASELESRKQFFQQLLDWQDIHYAIYLVASNLAEEQQIKEILAADKKLKKLKPHYLQGNFNYGFRLNFEGLSPALLPKAADPLCRGLVIATANELFGRLPSRATHKRKRAMPERQTVDQLLDFSELVEGDYLVHLQQGICIFRGLQKLDYKGKTEEVISLEFDNAVTLHLRLHESHLLGRYVGLSKSTPKLAKLGTNVWEKSCAGAERAAIDFAGELLSIQAKRAAKPGYAFSPDQAWQRSFEETFPHIATADQLRVIQEVKHDMEQAQPMDRLVCGDVGFGKTEIALRAAFKAVMDGKQVVVLIPTTVLAQQHFMTFKQRMTNFPVVVEMLSRFRSQKEREQIMCELATGKIDIIVGTHILLNKKITYHNPGLLIIDEEHRFGVKHKEQLKQLKLNLDVITMSATPIPRTLYFALMGARDLSVIETPPRDRLPIQTIVKNYDDKLVKDAIHFELNRGGQVFYLHNRVQTIHSTAEHLKKLLPGARIGIGHGQMNENMLEKTMTEFVQGRYEVLVCTTIIESGLDIPNCNTLIIEGADRFGLAQLYQLRGRVGRFNRQAYAYLLLHNHAQLLETARKRLSAIRQFNKLGAGFRIAMRDLELRGAGNLLGAKQSGHIATVGFDLYCQLLQQSIARLKGDTTAFTPRAYVNLDFVVVGETDKTIEEGIYFGYSALKADELQPHKLEKIAACIPVQYIQETCLRIDCYRKLALCRRTDEVSEIAIAMKDRFGQYPEPVETLIAITEIRCLAEQTRIVQVETEGNRLKCRYAGSKTNEFIKTGNRFPRLTATKPLLRLAEIKQFLQRLAITNL